MQCNILGATVPCLRIFLKHFSSGYLGGVGLDAPDEYYSRSATKNGTKDSFVDAKRSKTSSQGQHITVETSFSIEMRSTTPSSRNGREGPFSDRASEASITPLNPNTSRTKALWRG